MSNKLILGTVQMGIDYGVNNKSGKISEQEAFAILNHAYDHGVSILDTAEVYGTSHRLIGSFHQHNKLKKFKIITKLPHGFDAKNVEITIERYCRELEVEKIDFLLFHSFDSYVKGKTTIEELMRLKDKKTIDKIGVSIYTNEQADIVIDDESIDIVQLPFNLLDNFFTRGDVLIRAKQKGKIIHTRSVFLQGLFFLDRNSSHPTFKILQPYLDQLHRISSMNNMTISELALSYCLSKSEIDNVLIGVDSLAQLISNLDASAHSLMNQILNEVESIHVSEQDWLNPAKWN